LIFGIQFIDIFADKRDAR